MNDFDSVEVKPCPFCGGTVTRYNGIGAIRCKTCCTDGPYVNEGPSRVERATAAWNDRCAPTNQSDKDQLADLLLIDPATSEPCFIVSTLRNGPNGFLNFDVQSSPEATRWEVDVRISEALDQTKRSGAIPT